MASSPSPKQSIFSSLSLGRASRPKPSSETLTHPLLGASSSSLNLQTENSEAGPSQPPHARQISFTSRTSSDIVGNLPYKPRQRHGGGIGSASSATSIFAPGPGSSPSMTATGVTSPTPTAVSAPPTTSMSTAFDLPPSAMDGPSSLKDTVVNGIGAGSSSSATIQLQRQSLKAAAQRIGLGNGSMGMAMIDAIIDKSQASRPAIGDATDWGDLLRVLMAGKATLLLPTTSSSSLPITPQLLKDHVAFISPPTPPASANMDTALVVVTLSGIVGSLINSNLTFESTLPADSPILAILRDPNVSQTVLSSLRPTHLTTPAFPYHTLSSESATLPFPPIGRGPTTSPISIKEKAVSGRLGRRNPFSFFAATDTATSDVGQAPLSPPASSSASTQRPPSPSLVEPESATDQAEGFQLTAYAISKPIRYIEIQKAIIKSVRAFVRDELTRLPDRVVERVLKLVTAGVCPITGTGVDKELLKSHPATGDSTLNFDFADPSSTGERIQDFIEGVYDDLLVHFRADSSHIFGDGTGLKRRASGGIAWARGHGDDESEEAKKERKEKMRKERDEMAEKEASDGTERVEGVICRLLYNRLFSPLEADDARHDEVLASRIAALNMLDLSLDHLGLITRPDGEQEGSIADGLDKIVQRIGDELQKLSTIQCLTPRDKADILIHAHKIVVNGLAELPPIDLRPEGEPYIPPPEQASRAPSPALNTESSPAERSTQSTTSSFQPILTPTSASRDSLVPLANGTSRPGIGRSGSSASITRTMSVDVDPLNAISSPIKDGGVPLSASSSADVQSLTLAEEFETKDLAAAMSDSVHSSARTISRKPSADFEKPEASIPAPKPPKPSTSGADLLLPIIIYAVVKSNPPQLASQLMYLRRYRSAICLTGEASYAIVNLTAVVEFLEHVNLAELGLGGDSDKVISVDDLSPIGLDYLSNANVDAASIASASSRLRGRVFQVGEIAGNAAGSANKVITGVIDSSWTAVRGLINTIPTSPQQEESDGTVPDPTTGFRPGMRQRQASTFSLANVTASVANIAAVAAASTVAARTRSRANSRATIPIPEHVWGGNQELVEVQSRPASIREKVEMPTVSDHEEEEDEEEEGEVRQPRDRRLSDARSIKSVSSMMQDSRKEREKEKEKEERPTLSNRLAAMGLGRITSPGDGSASPITESPIKPTAGFLANLTGARSTSAAQSSTHTRRGSLLSPQVDPARIRESLASPPSSVSSLPLEAGDPPIDRFMTCEVGDIRLSEIGILLRDYRRLAGLIANQSGKQ